MVWLLGWFIPSKVCVGSVKIGGGRIGATVPKQHINKFAHALVEGQIYRITNFGLLRNSGKFKAAVHEFKLIFNATMKVIPCQNLSIPFSGYALMKTDDIKKTKGRSDYLLGSAINYLKI
ncbi:Nucleic acid-binding, OB-fold [Sesbania bispinosa]|nr:Nucleic acid-binding, OB-fold [Sesbania bispinosa]